MLVVAYPNKDVETKFEFDYWVAPFEGHNFFEFRGENAEYDMALFLGLITIAVITITSLIYRLFY